MLIALVIVFYRDVIIWSQSEGEPCFLKDFTYILRLDAVMASLDTFTKCAMFVGEMPIFIRRQILYSL